MSCWVTARAQVGIGTAAPNTHAVLELKNTTTPRGLLLPKVGTAQRTALAGSLAPYHQGLVVADTVAGKLYVWNGSGWDQVQSGTAAPLVWDRTPGNAYLVNGTDNVGIGISTPSARLHVVGSFRLVDGTQATGKVLTSDVNGVASWQFPAPGLTGTGVTTKLAVWNASTDLYGPTELHWDNTAKRLGIGTASPTQRLEVAGNIAVSGNVVATGSVTAPGDFYGRINIPDTRAVNDAPSTFDNEMALAFKERTAIGAPGASTFGGLMTIAPWNDNSGGYFSQLFFAADGIYHRTGLPDAATWNTWSTLPLSATGTANTVVKYTGGGMMGNSQILDNGTNVGIGVAPAAKLHVGGDVLVDGHYVVQNSVDGGSSRGIYMWMASDSNWGIYMGQSGTGKSLAGGNAVAGAGFSQHAIRLRTTNAGSQGILFENSSEQLNFSVRGSDGLTYVRGNLGVGITPTEALHLSGGSKIFIEPGAGLPGMIQGGVASATYEMRTTGTSENLVLNATGGGSVGIGVIAPSPNVLMQVGDVAVTVTQDVNYMSASAYPNGNASTPEWQSFTINTSGMLVSVGMYWGSSGSQTFTIYEGEGTGGPVLTTFSGSYSSGQLNHPLATPIPVIAGQVYTVGITNGFAWFGCNCDGYGGGISSRGAGRDFSIRANVRYQVISMTVTDNHRVGIGTTAPDMQLSVNGNASKTGGGSWATFSDARLKHLHGNYTRGLHEVLALEPVVYSYNGKHGLNNEDGMQYTGFMAQDVQKVIPEAVTTNAEGYLMLNQDPILWAMLNAIKEQNREIETLKAQVSTCGQQPDKQRLQQLEQENAELRARLERLEYLMGAQSVKQ
ncbi:MAG: tail fiber domain-containing protein [Bacteroidetes bacterium]|nr:tail fiber domain-containing protein [Bacteroidota bacterium]